MNDDKLLTLVAGAIVTEIRDSAQRRGIWAADAPPDDPPNVLLAKVKQYDPNCHTAIMCEASAILAALGQAGVICR